MNKFKTFMLLLFLLSIAAALQGIGLNPIKPYHLNKGALTKYLFEIRTEQEILAKAQIKVKFPTQFDQSQVAANLQCMAKSESYSWKTVPCDYVIDAVVLYLGTIYDEKMTILISSPRNPQIYEMSSYFQVCLMYNGAPTNCNKEFGKVVFPAAISPQSGTALFPLVNSQSSRVVGKASTYEFKFSTTGAYGVGNTIRITFPKGYTTSANPICQMTGTYNEIIQTFTWPNKRSIECQSINKQIHTGEVLKIVGIYNPSYAGTFGNAQEDGFYIEILEKTTTAVMEGLYIQKTITIESGEMQGYIVQANNFIMAKARYTFNLNLQNALSSANRDYILIRMLNSWIFYEDECSVVSGITIRDNEQLSCKNFTDGTYTYLNVSNFVQATITNQLVFNVYVGTPAIKNIYSVNVKSANDKGIIDTVDMNVVLNATYGTLSMLSINAITANSKVPVSGTGPLELTFFLNHKLPQTNVLTEGKFLIKIFPVIPLPPSNVNGVLKCYFFNDIPADTCLWDDTTYADYTLVTIRTPQTTSFQYSEIPITITTEGAVSEDKIGITIDDKVTRYRFELEAYKQDDLIIPTEVFYTEYIADSIYLPIQFTYLTKEANQQTAFKIQYTNPYQFVDPLMTNIRLKVEFLAGGGWASSLGYEPDRIYKRFPCIFYRKDQVPPVSDGNVECDLYTYLDGPHASLTDISSRGPYIIMHGFTSPLLKDENYRIQFARFLIGSSPGTMTYLRFSIIEETPTMLTKYIQLYYNEFEIFNIVSEQIATPASNAASLSLSDSRINLSPTHTISITVGVSSYFIVYEYDRESTPDFDEQLIECTSSNSLCAYFGYPVNWIIEYPLTASTFIAGAKTSTFDTASGIYSGTFQGLARAFDDTGLTLYKTTFNIVYSPRTIVTASFSADQTLYKGTEIYYTLYFDAITTTPDNGFIRLKVSSQMLFGAQPYCPTSNMVAYEEHRGIVCTLQDSRSTLKIFNIKSLSAGTRYTIYLRLMSTIASAGTIRPTIGIYTYYSLAVDYSIVDSKIGHLLSSSVTNYYTAPYKFEIENPKVTQELPRVGYIGKLSIIFRPTSDALNSNYLIIQLPKHQWNSAMFTTPGNVATDPLVCKINNIRVKCTYTLTSSLFQINLQAQQLNSGTDNEITLDTEYLVENGIKHPAEGGDYVCVLSFYDSSDVLIQQTSFYLKVLAPKLRNLYVYSAMNDVGLQNMFVFQIYKSSNNVRSYSDATRYGRIHFQFPTVDQLGNPLFEDDLGGYEKTGQYVGCDFTLTTYYVDSPTNNMRCRLIKSQVPGAPAIVELLNFEAFDGSNYRLKVYIARVHNPTRHVASIPLSVRMFQVEVATNNVYERYYDTYDVFVNGRTPSLSESDTSVNCNYYVGQYTSPSWPYPILPQSAFEDGMEVGAGSAWFRFYPNIKSPYSAGNNYYYVLKFPKDFIPNNREATPFNYIHSSYHHQVLTFPDISWIIVYTNTNPSYYQRIEVNLKLPDAVSQSDYPMPAMIWQSGRYLYVNNIIMTVTCQNQFRGTFSSGLDVQDPDDSDYAFDYTRRYKFVRVDFTVRHTVPKGGSIEIKWGANVPKAYPHCRSMTNIGSALTAEGVAENGEIGCLVQNTQSWVLTGFNTLSAGSAVKLTGYIDLPTGSSNNFGSGQIITYNSTHPTNIRGNGFIIDYQIISDFDASVSNEKSLNVNTEITLQQTLPLRASTAYRGPLQFKFKLPSNFVGPNSSKMRVRLPKRSVFDKIGGFSYQSAKKHACKISDILTHEEYGCIVVFVVEDTTVNSENILFQMISSSILSSSSTYKMKINTYTGVEPEGLIFPTVAGNYKVGVSFDIDNSGTFEVQDHLYLEVYGTPFAVLSVDCFVTQENQPNLIWVKLTPTTQITVEDQLVIEIPTKSTTGTTAFANDLGTGIADGDQIKYDILDNTDFTTGLMTCRLFHGDQTYGKSARIICGGFTQSIDSDEFLFFGFLVKNPSVTIQMSIPFFIYSQNINSMSKTNFNVVQNSVWVQDDSETTSDISSYGQLISGTQQQQSLNTYIQFTARNNWQTNSQSYYTMMFNFPLRKNGKVANGCTNPAGSTIYGDAYYHENLWVIVCTFTQNVLVTSSLGYQSRTLRVNGFYTPWFYLNANQQAIVTYTKFYDTTYSYTTGKGTISEGYPNEGPKTPSSPSLTITPIHNSAKYKGARDDLKIEFTFDTSSSDDLSYVKLIAFIFPTYFSLKGKDCAQSTGLTGSFVEIAQCWIQDGTRMLWIRPVQKDIYRNNWKISVTTQDLAIAYPTGVNSLNYNSFYVKYYSWENRNEGDFTIDPINNNWHASLLINNFPSATMSFAENPSGYTVDTFSYLKYPHQRYYKQTPYSEHTHRAPFQFLLQPSVLMSAVSGSSYHQISVYYAQDFKDVDLIKIRDLEVYRPVCYLDNKRIKKCVIDTSANKITMSFQFQLTQWTTYHVLFSITDPRNTDVFGFLPTKAVSSYRVEYINANNAGTIYYTETDKFPSLYSLPSGTLQGPFRGISNGQIYYGHAQTNGLNAVSMLLTFNRTDITALVFQIPLEDSLGNQLYSAGYESAAFLDLEDGASYPCGNNGLNAGGNVKCILKRGKYGRLTSPTRIIMTDFTYVTQMNCRFIFKNPSTANAFFSIRVKAYGGLKTATNLYGNQFMGQWDFQDIFQVVSGSFSTVSYDRSQKSPSKSPWRNSTTHYVFSGNQIGTNRISLAYITLSDSTSSTYDDEFCVTVLGLADDYDDLFEYTLVTSSGARIIKYAVFFRIWSTTTDTRNGQGVGWGLSYVKCKYYQPSFLTYWFYSDTSVHEATNYFTVSNGMQLSENAVSSPPINLYFDHDERIEGRPSFFTVQMDLTPSLSALTNFEFRNGDQMVLAFTFETQYWTDITECHVIGGIISTSPQKRATCTRKSSTQLYIRYISGFEEDPSLPTNTNKRIKFLFKGSSLISSVYSSPFQITTSLFSNYDAYNSGYQPIFREYSNVLNNCYRQLQSTATCTYVHTSDFGSFELLQISDTSLVVSYKPQSDFSYSTTSYSHRFDIDFYGFGYGSGCSVSNLVMEISTSQSPGSGANNTVAPSISAADHRLVVSFTSVFSTMWGGVAPANDNTWNSNEYIILYFTIAPGSVDLPVFSHSYLFAVGAYNYDNNQIRGVTSYLPQQSLGSSATVSTITQNRGGVTQLQIQVTELNKDIGPDNQNFLLVAEFQSSAGWTGSNDPFGEYTNTALQDEQIQCKCISNIGPLSISTTSPYADVPCRRRLPTGSAPFNLFSILIPHNANKGEDIKCFFPQFKIAVGMTLQIKFKLIYGNSYPIDITGGTGFGSVFSILSNSISYSNTSPDMVFGTMSSFSQSTNPYTSAVDVGTKYTGSTYTISGTFSSLNKPYIYLNFYKAGLIPTLTFCSDSTIYSVCRVYTGLLNLIVAQLKSTSASSFSMSKGQTDIYYPSSQHVSTSQFNCQAYVSNGGQWYYSRTISRDRSKLAPIDDNTFNVYSDLYGSVRSLFQNTIVLSMNIVGKTLYNFMNTGSKIEITFSGITHKYSCQVWVHNQPEVQLVCEVTSNKITIYTLRDDYSTSNNIFVNLGVTNPSTNEVTYYMVLYDYYYSSSRYSVVISRSAKITIDNTYEGNAEVEAQTVRLYPFQSRISLTSNAPLRMRFKLTATATSSNGILEIIYPQITYSTNYLCYFKEYSNYDRMDQDTQGTLFKARAFGASSSTLTIYPPKSRSLSSSYYYQLVVMPIGISSTGCTNFGCASQTGFQQQNFQTINTYVYNSGSPNTMINQQVQNLYEYQGTSKIALQQIYVLCAQSEETSLYFLFNLNFTSANDYPDHFVEIILWDLKQANFPGFVFNDQIPCQLSSNFVGISNREDPACILTEAEDTQGYAKIRIINIGTISVGKYWVTLDDITLPNPNTLSYTEKFDISIRYIGPSNLKYENYFREIFLIDDTYYPSAATLGASFNSPSVITYGISINGIINFPWPFTTSTGDQSKVSFNINGGYSKTWTDINNVNFVDSSGTYQLLWVNKKLNKFVLALPAKSVSTNTNLNITSLKNPYPYQKEDYELSSAQIQVNFYQKFVRKSSKTFAQPTFSTFTKPVAIVGVDQYLPSNKIDVYPLTGVVSKLASGSTGILRLGIIINEEPQDIIDRKLDVLDIQFTSGVSYVDECRVVRNSTTYVNPKSTCQTYLSGGNWHVVIYYVTESQMNTYWWLQVVAQFNSITIGYTSRLKARNDVVEYEDSHPSVSITNYYSATNVKPTTLSWLNRKYVKNFYENQWRYLSAISGQTTPYLRMRFTVDSAYDGPNDYTLLYLRQSSVFVPGQTSHIKVFLLPAVSSEQDFGIGHWAEGKREADGSNYAIRFIFKRGWISGKDYLLQIQESNIVTTSFASYSSPGNYEMTMRIHRYSGTHYDDYDTFKFAPTAPFDAVSIIHTTTTVNDYDSLLITYTPSLAVSAGTTTTQTFMLLQIMGLYHEADGGLSAIYTADGIDIESGFRYSEVVSNPSTNPANPEVTTVNFGQYSNDYTPIKISLRRTINYVAHNVYTWRVPLLKNPSVPYETLRYNISLVHYPASSNYPVIKNFYQSVNEHYTVADTSVSFNPTVLNTIRNVQVNNAIDLEIDLAGYSLSQWDVAIFKLDNSYEGLLQDFTSGSDSSNYDYFYFHSINMVLAQKKTTNNVVKLGIGSASSSLNYQRYFKFSWVRIFDTSNAVMTTNPKTLKYGDPPSLQLNYLTSYTTTAITKLQGTEFEGSAVMYKVDVTVPIIPLGGQIQFLIDSTKIDTDSGTSCKVHGNNFIRSSSDSQVMRCYRFSGGFKVTGFTAVATNTPLSVYLPIKSKVSLTAENIGINIYGIYTDTTSSISKKADSVSVSHVTDSVPSVLEYKKQIFEEYYGSFDSGGSHYREFQGTLILRDASLQGGDRIRLYIQHGFSGTPVFRIKQNDTNHVQWTQLSYSSASGSWYYFNLPYNYDVTHTLQTNVQYIWRLTTVRAPETNSGYNNGLITQSWDDLALYYESQNGGSSTNERQYDDLIVTPVPKLLTITNRYPAAGQKTMLEFSFHIDFNASTNLWMQLFFDSNNLLQQMFAQDLQEKPVDGQQYKYVDCRQLSNSEISNSRINCFLYYGDNSVDPPKPARLYIPLTNNLNVYYGNFNINFVVANVRNPPFQNMNVGVTLKLYKYCVNKYNAKCALVEARGFYVTTSGTQNLQTSTSSFTPSSNIVLDTGINHQFVFESTAVINSNDMIEIFYPTNFQQILHPSCLSSGYTCYSFPIPRIIVLIPTGQVISGAGTLTINLNTYMRNGYYSQSYEEDFIIKVSRDYGAVTPDAYYVRQLHHIPISRSITSGTATNMIITATQNDDIFLRNYANTVEIVLDNIFMDTRIKAIYIKAPSEVTHWDAKYCNASITATSDSSNTYPLRFTCRQYYENNTVPVLQLIPQTQDLGVYDPVWDDSQILVHAKFTLGDFPPGEPDLYVSTPTQTVKPFEAFGSVNTTSDDPKYYLSQCSSHIMISQHLVPIISDITFNQESFAYRTAKVNNKQVFYLLLEPRVSNEITKMVFQIPLEFDYPGIFEHDNCFMIGRVKEDQNYCKQSRENGKTLITIVPENYDNSVRIIQLGSVSQQNWFTAPELPGNFYNMTVELYGIDDDNNFNLLQKQTKDISPVYGQFFDLPSISIKNTIESDISEAIYDIQFITGSLQIPPGAPTTATNLYTEFQFIFESYNPSDPTNAFTNDLGTGLEEGDEVGCVIHEGIVALQNQRIKCLLHIGTNSTDKPMIRIINYNYIDPQTTIRLSFAAIESLSEIKVNTISIGVLLFYSDLQSQTYLYIPTAKVTQPTNSSFTWNDYFYMSGISQIYNTWLNYWYFQSSNNNLNTYNGNNIVRQPTNFSISVRGPYYYPSTPTSYSSNGEEEDFILLKIRPKYLIDPYNTVPITCNICSGDIEVFYATGIVRFRISGSIYSSYITFSFQNFPSSAYSIANETVSFDMEIYDDYRLFRKFSWTRTRTVEKCSLFNFGVLSVSSLNGGQIGVTYTFSLITNHYIPPNGAISITIPQSYGDMTQNGVTCEIQGFEQTNAYCLIETPSRVDIYLNGSELQQSSSYIVILDGLQNPNEDSSGLIFFMTSYFDDNIYENHKICENSVTPPTITVKAVRTCTLSWSASFVNKDFNATHQFVVSCDDLFRGQSVLYIALPDQFSNKNNLGSIKCTSLQASTLVDDTCTLSYINGTYMLWTEIDATSQTSLTILLDLVNPTNNTYQTQAQIFSRGVVYVNTESALLTILSTKYLKATSGSTYLLNSPKEAGLMATYIFKIRPMNTFIPSNLAIEFPDNFYVDENELNIGITTSQNSAFFNYLTYDSIQVMVNNISSVANVSLKAYPSFSTDINTIFISNISASMNSSEWTYVFIRGIKNPSTYLSLNFTVAYYLDSVTYKTLQWIMNGPLVYKISSPPKYLALESISVSDTDLLYPSVYTFKFRSGTGEPIAIQGMKLSFVIVIPNFYKSTIWANSNITCKFDELSVNSPCQNYESEIIITETFSTNLSSLTISISKLLNPALQTYCDTDDVTLLSHTFFKIRIIEVESNKFMFESSSVVDGSNCLKFQSSRIPISLEHSLTMIAGLAYNLTYSITKPAMNLKIRAIATATGFTFSPNVVQFNDYYTLKKTTTIYLRSDITPGNYTISFEKLESDTQTFFRNILPTTIQVVSPQSSSFVRPTITIPSISVSTIGYPVQIPIVFSLPSSTQMTLSIKIAEESNQTLEEYSPHFSNFSLTPRIINIVPQQSKFSFVITQGKQTVPPKITLEFTLTSVYTIIHNLTTKVVTVCFNQDPTFDVLFPPLRITTTQFASSCDGSDVGKKVTNIFVANNTAENSQSEIVPEIIKLEVSDIKSTSASVIISTRTSGTVYYLCVNAGEPEILSADEITSMTHSDIGNTGTVESSAQNVYVRSTAQINYVGIASVGSLSSETKYMFYAVLMSELGTSTIKKIPFRTTDLSRGIIMKLGFSDIVTQLQIVKALEKVLRIAPSRIKVLTSPYELQAIKTRVTSNHNNPQYVYEVVVAPDPTNDTKRPIDIVKQFEENKQTQQSLKKLIPVWNIPQKIIYNIVVPTKPRVAQNLTLTTINLYNATGTINFWERAKIYGVLIVSDEEVQDSLSIAQKPIVVRRVSELPEQEKKLIPSSQQIRYGKGKDNKDMGKYRKFEVESDGTGKAVIFLDDLKEGKKYRLCATGGAVTDYPPETIWDDEQVIVLQFVTLRNPNLKKSNRHLDELKKYNPGLGEAIERFIIAEERKRDKSPSS